MVGYRCTCAPLFRISGTAGWIALKLGVIRGPLAMRFTQNGVASYAFYERALPRPLVIITVLFETSLDNDYTIYPSERRTAWLYRKSAFYSLSRGTSPNSSRLLSIMQTSLWVVFIFFWVPEARYRARHNIRWQSETMEYFYVYSY